MIAPRTIAAMEEAMIALHELWWRSPGSGSSAWAGDGPWNLAQREPGDTVGHYSLMLVEREDGREVLCPKLDHPRPRTPLSAAEVTARDALAEWLVAVPGEADRQLVRLATLMLWRGEGRVSWDRLRPNLNGIVRRELADLAECGEQPPRSLRERSAAAWRQRYRAVLAEMVCRANRKPVRFARALRARDDVLPFD